MHWDTDGYFQFNTYPRPCQTVFLPPGPPFPVMDKPYSKGRKHQFFIESHPGFSLSFFDSYGMIRNRCTALEKKMDESRQILQGFEKRPRLFS